MTSFQKKQKTSKAAKPSTISAAAAKNAPLSAFLETYRKPLSRGAAIFFLALVIFGAPVACQGQAVALPAIGLLFVTLGTLGRLWCALYISGHKNSTLLTDGPYSVSRNALYFFSFVGLLGVTLYLQQGLLTLIIAPLFLLYYHFVIRSEELRLQEIFGAEYTKYLASTPRFFPKFSLYRTRESLTVEPARMLKAARDVVWFFLAIIFLGVLKALQAQEIIPVLVTLPF